MIGKEKDMIKRFYVENFSSIKERIDVSFEASKMEDDTYYNNVFKFKDFDILKVSAFYGMNASGKSRIIMALAAIKELVIPLQVGPRTPYYPFKFDEKKINAPIDVGIEFSLHNNEDSPIYRYSVSYNNRIIIKERLEKLITQKPSLLFERTTANDGATMIKLGATVQGNLLLQEITKTIVPDRTFLSMFNQFKIEDFYDAYSFFLNNVINISPVVTRFDDVVPNRIIEDEKLKDFTIRLLKAADFNITDLYVGKAAVRNLPLIAGIKAERDALFLTHKGDGPGGSLEFIDESLGTKKIVVLAAHLYAALSRPSVLIVDELETSLHPELTKLIVKCFLDETINPFNSQLIFTSHETTLLNLNLLRRDQINFVYKDEKTCGTYIRSLKDFHVRKTDSVEKAYIAGRYLTSPEVREQLLERETDA